MIKTHNSIQSHALLIYFLIVTAITVTFDGAILAFTLSWTRDGPPSLARHLHMLVTWSPLIAGIIAAFLEGGRAGVRDLWAGVFRWRFSPILYVLAVCTIGGIYFAGAGLHLANGGDLDADWLKVPQPFLPMLIAQIILVALPEELGWRGYALPRLQAGFGSLGASLLLGLFHALWHLPLFMIPGTLQHGESFPLFAAIVVAWSVFMTTLFYRSGGSTLTAILFHAALNLWAAAVELPEAAWMLAYVAYIPAVLAALLFLPRPLFKSPCEARQPCR